MRYIVRGYCTVNTEAHVEADSPKEALAKAESDQWEYLDVIGDHTDFTPDQADGDLPDLFPIVRMAH